MRGATLAVFALVCVACGGAAPATGVNAPPQPSASASASADTGAPPATPEASIIHYDDVGITFAVPRFLHVMGDDELASRVRSSASEHLKADLQTRAAAKRGVPLLALTTPNLNVTLLIVAVPADATAMELATHQRDAMAANLASFQSTAPPKEITTDGVSGAELETRYVLNDVGMASRSRMYVRRGVGTILTIAWKETSEAGGVTALFDGLHFTALAQ